MAFASTYNTPTGVQTDVSGASAGFPGGPGGMDMGWLMEMAKRRAQQKLQAGDISNAAANAALGEAKRARYAPQRAPQLTPNEQNAQRAMVSAQEQEAIARQAQARAVSGVAPTRTSFGINFIKNGELDTQHMTGAQRQASLPQNAGFSGPSLSEHDAYQRQIGLEDMSRRQAEARGLTDRSGNMTEYGNQQSNPQAAYQQRMQQMSMQNPEYIARLYGRQKEKE
jgi:hypothetical protein